MPDADEVTIESIVAGAALARMPLSEDEARELVPGVQRMRRMAAGVRALLAAETEPAPVFDPRSGQAGA